MSAKYKKILKAKEREKDEIINFGVDYFTNLEKGKVISYQKTYDPNLITQSSSLSSKSDNLMKGGGVMGTTESFNKNKPKAKPVNIQKPKPITKNKINKKQKIIKKKKTKNKNKIKNNKE